MATSYTFDFTDQNPARSFGIAPYTTNGPRNPTASVLDTKATSASTSLLFYGKGAPEYGERLQENFVHLLENFASAEEPAYPSAGQLWYDRSKTPNQLSVFNNKSHEIISVDDNNQTITIAGDHTLRLNGLAGRGINIVISSNDPAGSEDFVTLVLGTSTTVASPLQTIIPVTGTAGGVSAITHVGWFLGDWELIQQDNILPATDIDLTNTYGIYNIIDPTSGNMVGDRDYCDGRYVKLTGDTMSGTLTLAGDPTLPLEAATKNYVDVAIGSTLTFVQVTGDTMTGNLDMSGNSITSVSTPTSPSDVANMLYVDQEISAHSHSIENLTNVVVTSPVSGNVLVYNTGSGPGTEYWENVDLSSAGFVPVSGATMTGFLELHANPLNANHPATKQYVDAAVTGGADVVTGITYDSVTGQLALSKAITAPLTTIITAAGSSATSAIVHTNHPNWDKNESGEDFIEKEFHKLPTYPDLPLHSVIQKMSEILAGGSFPSRRALITATGATTYTLPFDDGDIVDPGKLEYLVGFNQLQVFVNGIKQVTNVRAAVLFEHDEDALFTPADAYQTGGLSLTAETGFVAGSTYNLDVTFDGTTYPIAVPGANALTVAGLLEEVSAQLDAYGNPGTLTLIRGTLRFSSATTGASSSVSISDGASPGLIANLYGEWQDSLSAPLYDPATSYVTGDYVKYVLTQGPESGQTQYYRALTDNTGHIPENDRENWRVARRFNMVVRNPIAGATYGYSENGLYANISTSITFTNAPPAGALIEAIITNPMQYAFGY